jgi:dTDP-4-amino-4,6-dideoxygalactose transaminase
MTGLRIPFTGLQKQYHNLRAEILDATDEVMRSGQLMSGNYTAEFESWLANRNRVRHAVTLHSGTSALECLAEYHRQNFVTETPRVLVPSLTYAATANAFARSGWDVVFADTDHRGIIDVTRVGDAGFHAVVLVGLYGAGVSKFLELNTYQGWINEWMPPRLLIEDAAQHWLSDGCQRIADAALSFDPMKNLSAPGNGGALVTDSSGLAEFAQDWRDNGKSRNHNLAGTNSRISELDAAVLMVKTRYIDQWQVRRRQIATYWIERLEQHNTIRCLIDRENMRGHALHKFVIDVDDRDVLRQQLAQQGIETRVHYSQPLHEMGLFRQYPGPDIMSRASSLARRVLSLPLYPELTDLQVEYIIDQVLVLASQEHN